ncbi:MAG TPA: hypothetical protein VNK24_10350 [Elusimicrobiota bacterium]|nr:hypothetical protein [Elusimicrobiota bacterium]
MVRPEIVDYLKENINLYPPMELRRRLADEGVSDVDFDDSLKAALAPPPPKSKKRLSRNRKLLFMASGALLCLGAGLMIFQQSSGPSSPPAATDEPATAIGRAQSAFLGHYGYVVSLPPGYGCASEFTDPRKTDERVYFAKTGTQRADFIDTGLYGQMGIVRLDAQPNPWAGELDGADELAAVVMARLKGQDNQFTVKNIQVGTLRGIQVDFQAPFSHVETYLLGDKTMFSLYAGKNDAVYQFILTSLRDEAAEG